MNEPWLDPQIVRDWVYQELQKPMPPHTPELETLLLNVHIRACQAQGITVTTDLASIAPQLQDMIRGVMWDLIIQGILIPGKPNQHGSGGLPAFVISDWGRKCLQTGEYVTFDAFKYLSRLDTDIPGFDGTAKQYLRDSLASFRTGAYLSSAVMTGVASERLILLLRDAVRNALPTPARQQKFEADTNGFSINRIFQETWKRLEPTQATIASDLCREDVKVELVGIFDLIRKTRNEAGHPTGRQMTRDEADSILHLFPVYGKTVYATIDWLTKNQLA